MMLIKLSVGSDMQFKAFRQKRFMGILLTFLLVCFSLPSLAATASAANDFLTPPHDVVKTITQDTHTSLSGEPAAPAKSLSPSSVLRNGAWLLERRANNEPDYELVIELAKAVGLTDQHDCRCAFSHWQDWTRSPPPARHRLAGWKDSNLQFRFITQAHA